MYLRLEAWKGWSPSGVVQDNYLEYVPFDIYAIIYHYDTALESKDMQWEWNCRFLVEMFLFCSVESFFMLYIHMLFCLFGRNWGGGGGGARLYLLPSLVAEETRVILDRPYLKLWIIGAGSESSGLQVYSPHSVSEFSFVSLCTVSFATYVCKSWNSHKMLLIGTKTKLSPMEWCHRFLLILRMEKGRYLTLMMDFMF